MKCYSGFPVKPADAFENLRWPDPAKNAGLAGA